MAFDTVPFTIDGTTVDGEVIRRALGTLIGPTGGIVNPGDLQVTQNGTPNMSVNIATGELWVPGSSTPSQGPYYSRNGATVNEPISAANPSEPRVDTVIAQLQDAAYAGSLKQLQPAVITGTPTAGVVTPPTTAAQAATDGAGAVPASSYVLAYVLVPASATSIVNADIANVASAVGTFRVAGGAATFVGNGLSTIQFTMPHGLGRAPSAAIASPVGWAGYMLNHAGADATNIYWEADGQSAFGSGTVYDFYWIAL